VTAERITEDADWEAADQICTFEAFSDTIRSIMTNIPVDSYPLMLAISPIHFRKPSR
jgi:hypothetical protein